MPCIDPGADGRERTELRDKVDNLTAMLCAVCEQLTGHVGVFIVDPHAKLWWERHVRQDAERRKAEAKVTAEADHLRQIRTDALAKLSPEQRRALGF